MPDDAYPARKARLLAGWQHPGYPWTIRTIADFLTAGYGITVQCRACRRFAALDLVALGEQKGRDLDLTGPALDGLTCQTCGAKSCDKLVTCETAGRKSIWSE